MGAQRVSCGLEDDEVSVTIYCIVGAVVALVCSACNPMSGRGPRCWCNFCMRGDWCPFKVAECGAMSLFVGAIWPIMVALALAAAVFISVGTLGGWLRRVGRCDRLRLLVSRRNA